MDFIREFFSNKRNVFVTVVVVLVLFALILASYFLSLGQQGKGTSQQGENFTQTKKQEEIIKQRTRPAPKVQFENIVFTAQTPATKASAFTYTLETSFDKNYANSLATKLSLKGETTEKNNLILT